MITDTDRAKTKKPKILPLQRGIRRVVPFPLSCFPQTRTNGTRPGLSWVWVVVVMIYFTFGEGGAGYDLIDVQGTHVRVAHLSRFSNDTKERKARMEAFVVGC